MISRADLTLRWVRGPDVLDVGAAGHRPDPSSAQWLHGRLREAFPSVIGLDLSEENVEMLKAMGYPNLQAGDAQTFQIDGRFDTIVAGEVIEHLENPAQFLTKAHEHLKPDGRLVLTTPYAFGLLNWVYALLRFPRTCINPEHTMWFCPMTIAELSKRAGFSVAHWELILDLPDRPNAPVALKRAVVWLYERISRVLPLRLRCNGMLFVLRVSEDHDGVEKPAQMGDHHNAGRTNEASG